VRQCLVAPGCGNLGEFVPQAGDPAQIVVADVHGMLDEKMESDPMNAWRCDQLSAAGGGLNCSACGHGATKLRLPIE
jgi:hypothetical protein